MKQEHKVESLNNFISELEQQACARRLDLENAHHGYVVCRREQVRPQEELVMKAKVHQKTQIRCMQDCPRLTGNSLCGENHLYCVIEVFEI